MEPFVEIPSFYGSVRPLRFEASIHDCEVIGAIPPQLDGAYFRAGPDTHYPTLPEDNIINGDGVVSAFRFQNGHVDFACRYVRTERFRTEWAARRRLYGKYRNPYTDDPSTVGTDRDNTANTTAFFHSGRLFALREDSWPHEIDPFTLETRDTFNFRGKLQSKTLAAHPKIDPVTGEWWSMSLFAQKRFEGEMALQVINRDGELVRELEFQAPFPGLCHDFAVTRTHVIIPIMPLTVDLQRVRRGGDFYAYDADRPSAWGVMPRDGGAQDMRWYILPRVSIGHVMNAFTEEGRIHVDVTASPGNAFAFYRDIHGQKTPPVVSTMTRVSFDLAPGITEGSLTPFAGAVGEMPRCDERFAMGPYRYGYMKSRDGINRIDWKTGANDVHAIPDSPGGAQEPIFVPRHPDSPEGDGFIICMVNRAPQNVAELRVLDAQHLAKDPLAVVRLPFNQPMAFHGCFVPAAQLPTSV